MIFIVSQCFFFRFFQDSEILVQEIFEVGLSDPPEASPAPNDPRCFQMRPKRSFAEWQAAILGAGIADCKFVT